MIGEFEPRAAIVAVPEFDKPIEAREPVDGNGDPLRVVFWSSLSLPSSCLSLSSLGSISCRAFYFCTTLAFFRVFAREDLSVAFLKPNDSRKVTERGTSTE